MRPPRPRRSAIQSRSSSRRCTPIKALPDLSRCPKLRVLIVDDCGLVSVHRSFTPANHPKLERLVVSGNPGLEGRERAKIDAFAATTTANGGWVRG